MKTKITAIPESTIEKFAEELDLEMVIKERREPVGSPMCYYASFSYAEEQNNGFLISNYGNGATPEDAVNDYAKQIEMKTLVIHDYTDARREIKVPRLIHAAS